MMTSDFQSWQKNNYTFKVTLKWSFVLPFPSVCLLEVMRMGMSFHTASISLCCHSELLPPGGSTITLSGDAGYYKGVEGRHQARPGSPLWPSVPQGLAGPAPHPSATPAHPQTPRSGAHGARTHSTVLPSLPPSFADLKQDILQQPQPLSGTLSCECHLLSWVSLVASWRGQRHWPLLHGWPDEPWRWCLTYPLLCYTWCQVLVLS